MCDFNPIADGAGLQRSHNHQFEEEVAHLAQQQGRQLRRGCAKVVKVALAMTEALPEVYVSIQTPWVPEKVISKRYSEKLGCYEYLVKYESWGDFCNVWTSPTDLEHCVHLVQQYEDLRNHCTREERDVEAFFPYEEGFAVQWKDFPYFVVPYGGGQWNNFCVVGLDHQKQKLKCKYTRNADVSVHLAHVQAVKKKMQQLTLCIHKGKILPAAQVAAMSSDEIHEDVPDVVLEKPVSKTKIHLLDGASGLEAKRDSWPVDLKPLTHPRFCKCESVGDSGPICGTEYRSEAERCKTTKDVKLWVNDGLPLTDRRVWVWKCKRGNASCNVYYDGATDGIFNYSNCTLISYVVLFDLLFSFISRYTLTCCLH
jgi:hypothetical protein